MHSVLEWRKQRQKQYIAIGKTDLFYNSMGLYGNFILPYLVSHGNLEKVKVLKITVICNLAVSSWLLYKIEFHKSQKFHGFLNGSIMEGNYCKL